MPLEIQDIDYQIVGAVIVGAFCWPAIAAALVLAAIYFIGKCFGAVDEDAGPWEIAQFFLAVLFSPLLLLGYCCSKTAYPLTVWCISEDGWLSKYTMKDVAYFLLSCATVVFFALDTFDMVLDFKEVNKLRNLCEHRYVRATPPPSPLPPRTYTCTTFL